MSDHLSHSGFSNSYDDDSANTPPRWMPYNARPIPSNTNSTPSECESKTEMSEAAKRRVGYATEPITGQRCLIEDTLPGNHPQYAHCLARSTHRKVLESLEYSWNMRWGALNVDTRQNIMRLTPKFHAAFDANKWLLLPEASIVAKYFFATDNRVLPVIDDPVYKYTLIAHADMWDIPIHRQTQPPPPPGPGGFTYFPHPYRDFPVIKSHVHPKFAICNGGPKIASAAPKWTNQNPAYETLLLQLWSIWHIWSSVDPPKDFYDLTPDDEDGDDNDTLDNNSRRTRRRFRTGTMLGKRKTRAENQSPTPGDSRIPGQANDGVWLDGETLNDFNHQMSCADIVGVKEQLVLDWLKSVSESESNTGTDLTLGDQVYTKAHITDERNAEVDLVA